MFVRSSTIPFGAKAPDIRRLRGLVPKENVSLLPVQLSRGTLHIVLAGITLTGVSRSEDEGKGNAEAVSDRKKVEFFEKLYKMKIKGVKPLEEYKDPDSFYAAIARQVGIPKKAFDAVNKKYGWKQNDEFFLSAMVKGGWDGDYWGVMVTKFPAALKEAKSKEEKMKLLKGMEMKMVVIGYDGAISFPDEPDTAEQDATMKDQRKSE